MAEQEHPKPEDNGKKEITFRNVQLLKDETLGTGSYGAVCKAKCDQLICAAKLLFSILFRMQAPEPGKEHRQPFHRFEQECRFLSRVNHPNIVQYLGTYRDPETNAPVLLMELMDESLTHFLESSPGDISYHIQVNLSQDIAQALAFLHASGIIHCDLSSNNVLLTAGTRAKVSDFGMSKFADTNITSMTQCPGTLAFMSPEALYDNPVYTEKLDNFSFGVLLIQIMTRKFPKPSHRDVIENFPDPQNPTVLIKVKIPVSELKRRQTHISLIEPTHPLLPIALECLKDETDERPSSQQLCQSLDALKRTVEYEESQQQDAAKLVYKQAQKQLKSKDQELRALQYEFETSKHHSRQQLESNVQLITALQHTISQRDIEIAKLKGNLESKNCDEAIQSYTMRDYIGQATFDSEEDINMSWQSLCTYATGNHTVPMLAVVGERVYFSSYSLLKFWNTGASVWEFALTSKWKRLREHPLRDFSLLNIDNELTTVGGCSRSFAWISDSNKLYSYTEGQWVEKYPPMPTKRSRCTSVYTRSMLIVVGGWMNNDGSTSPTGTLEILNIFSKQWYQVCSLPFETTWPMVSISGDYIYVSNGYTCVRCSLLPFTPSPGTFDCIWEEIKSLQIEKFALVTMKGHLLAIGGQSTKGNRTKEVCQYNPNTDSWQVISPMNVARSHCAAALLSENQLMVAGGTEFRRSEMIELATIL